ncbi:phage late control D family protein [Sphaerisporangium rhizosphaerae]|uniref:Phage late control D family protein n=1 Tax=Sphaerisporangium rhizosphaerae TaxID=2269375 RepID=A0ABW2PHE6_9ACTN
MTGRYAPAYALTVDGEPLPLPLRACVTGVRYADALEGANRVEITLADQRPGLLDHPLLRVDARLELALGYAPDPLEPMFTGEITGVDASFPSGGVPTITVVAHDFMQRLTIGAKDRAFALSLPCIGRFPLPDPVIAAAVGATNLLVPVVDPVGAALSFLALLATYAIDPADAKRSIRIQQGQSDFELLTGVARDNGWDMYVDHTAEPRGYVLRFQFPGGHAAPAAVLKWGESLIDFNPRITTVGQVASVATRIWVSAINAEFVIALAWDYDRGAFDLQVYPGLGDLDAIGAGLGDGGGGRGTLIVEADGPATAPRRVLGELLPRLNNRLTASGTTVGDPRLRAGRVIAVEGLGPRFGGLYRLTSVTHTIDGSGYRSAFEVRKEVWFTSPVPGLRAQGVRIF